jgi:hypothetical protein
LREVLRGGSSEGNYAQTGSREHEGGGAGRIQHHAPAEHVDAGAGTRQRRGDLAVAVVREVFKSTTSTRPVSEGVALAAVTGMLKRA